MVVIEAILALWAVSMLKVAVTVLSAFATVEQLPAPVQPLDQPVKTENSPAVALSVTGEPAVKPCQQSVLQLMPVGELVTVPLPVPGKVTPMVYSAGCGPPW